MLETLPSGTALLFYCLYDIINSFATVSEEILPRKHLYIIVRSVSAVLRDLKWVTVCRDVATYIQSICFILTRIITGRLQLYGNDLEEYLIRMSQSVDITVIM